MVPPFSHHPGSIRTHLFFHDIESRGTDWFRFFSIPALTVFYPHQWVFVLRHVVLHGLDLGSVADPLGYGVHDALPWSFIFQPLWIIKTAKGISGKIQEPVTNKKKLTVCYQRGNYSGGFILAQDKARGTQNRSVYGNT